MFTLIVITIITQVDQQQSFIFRKVDIIDVVQFDTTPSTVCKINRLLRSAISIL